MNGSMRVMKVNKKKDSLRRKERLLTQRFRRRYLAVTILVGLTALSYASCLIKDLYAPIKAYKTLNETQSEELGTTEYIFVVDKLGNETRVPLNEREQPSELERDVD